MCMHVIKNIFFKGQILNLYLFLKKKSKLTLFYMYNCFWLHVCMGAICMPHACGSQKRESGPLELELQMV